MAFTNNYGGPLVNMDVSIDIKMPPDMLERIALKYEEQIPKVLNQIGLLGHTYWTQLAAKKLSTSRRDYTKALSYRMIGGSGVQLTLGGSGTGTLNTTMIAIELGGPKFDMKPGFLNSPKAKTGKRKFPKAVADAFVDRKGPSKYMIVPLVQRDGTVASAGNVKFRTVSTHSPDSGKGSWWHPGWKGVNLREEVLRELNERIIPEAFAPLLDNL